MKFNRSIIVLVALICVSAIAADGVVSKRSVSKGRLPDLASTDSPQIGTNLPPIPPGLIQPSAAPIAPVVSAPVPSVIRLPKEPLLGAGQKSDSTLFLTQSLLDAPPAAAQDVKPAAKLQPVAEKTEDRVVVQKPEASKPAQEKVEPLKPEKVEVVEKVAQETVLKKEVAEPKVANAPARVKRQLVKVAKLPPAKKKQQPVLESTMSDPPQSAAVVTPIPDSLVQAVVEPIKAAPVESRAPSEAAAGAAEAPSSATAVVKAEPPSSAAAIAEPVQVAEPKEAKPVQAPVPVVMQPSVAEVTKAVVAEPGKVREAAAQVPVTAATQVSEPPALPQSEPKVVIVRVEVPVSQPEPVAPEPARVTAESMVKKGYLGSSLGGAVRIDANGRVIR